MTRNEFLNEIYTESGFMLPGERRKAVNYFRERFACGKAEADVCETLGEPGAALKRYIAESKKEGMGTAKKLLLYAAALFSAPAAVYVAAIILVFSLLIIVAALALLAAFPLAGAWLWLDGIGSAVDTAVSGAAPADCLCSIGLGLLVSGIGIFIMLGVYKLYKKLIPWLINEIAASYRRIRSKIRGKKQ